MSLLWLSSLGCSSGPILILSAKSVTPSTVAAGSPATITVMGEQFSTRTAIQLGSTVSSSTFVSPTEMTVVLPAVIYNSPGAYPLSIVDAEPALQGGTGVLATSLVVSVHAPAPTVTAVSPALLLAGQPQSTIVIAGSGFLPTTTVTVNGVAHAVTFQDPQHLSLQLTNSDLLVAQALSLVLTSAAPGGGSSDPLLLPVTNYTKAASTYTAYGDSITYGYQLSSATLAYPYLLASANSLSLTDWGVIGDESCDTMDRINKKHDGYTPQTNVIFTYMIGTNETYNNGSGAYEQVFNACDQGVLSWLALPSSAKVQPGATDLQVSGGCKNTAYAARYGAIHCTDAGSITDQGFVTYGAPIYLWLLLDNAASSATSMQVTVDGVSKGSYSVAPFPAINTINHATNSVGLVRVPVDAGTHVISLSATGSGAGPLGIGNVPASKAALPPIVVGDLPNQRLSSAYASTAVQLAYSADIRANVALLRGDGPDLRFAADRSTMTGTDAEMADSLHPNALGQQHLQAAFQTGLVALNSQAGLVAQLAHGETPLPAAGSIQLISPRTEEAAYSLPELVETVTVRNVSTRNAAWIDAGEVGGLINGSMGIRLAPEQTITFRQVEQQNRRSWSTLQPRLTP